MHVRSVEPEEWKGENERLMESFANLTAQMMDNMTEENERNINKSMSALFQLCGQSLAFFHQRQGKIPLPEEKCPPCLDCGEILKLQAKQKAKEKAQARGRLIQCQQDLRIKEGEIRSRERFIKRSYGRWRHILSAYYSSRTQVKRLKSRLRKRFKNKKLREH